MELGRKLLNIQEIDEKLAEIEQKEKKLKELEEFLQKVAEKSDKLSERVDKDKKRIVGLKRDSNRLENEIEKIEQKYLKKEKEIYENNGFSPKELESIQDSIEEMKKLKNELEDELLVAMDNIEDAVQSLNKYHGRQLEVEKEHRKGKKKLLFHSESIMQRKNELLAAKEDLEKELPGEWLDYYHKTRIRYRNKVVVRMEGNICSGCRVELPIYRRQIIKENKELQICDLCGRIILPPE